MYQSFDCDKNSLREKYANSRTSLLFSLEDFFLVLNDRF